MATWPVLTEPVLWCLPVLTEPVLWCLPIFTELSVLPVLWCLPARASLRVACYRVVRSWERPRQFRCSANYSASSDVDDNGGSDAPNSPLNWPDSEDDSQPPSTPLLVQQPQHEEEAAEQEEEVVVEREEEEEEDVAQAAAVVALQAFAREAPSEIEYEIEAILDRKVASGGAGSFGFAKGAVGMIRAMVRADAP